MDLRGQQFCLYGGLVFIVVFFLGWGIIAGFMTPLPTPRDNAQEVIAFFSGDQTRIRLGVLLVLFVAPLQAFFAALITLHLKRIGDKVTPLANAQMMMGGISVLLVTFPCFMWEVLAFRAVRDPDTVRLLNDFAWLSFIGAFAPAMFQSLAIGVAILMDDDEAVFPRWLAYLNFWIAFAFIPGGIVFFAMSGPFAWNGLLAFWVPAFVFGIWFVAMFVMVRRAMLPSIRTRVPNLEH
jgi:hypothetical protein